MSPWMATVSHRSASVAAFALEVRGCIDVVTFRAPGELIGSTNGLHDVAPEMKFFPPLGSFDQRCENDEVELLRIDAFDERLNRRRPAQRRLSV